MLKLNNITKRFPGIVALDDVTMSFEKGEIHALLGENGAGKSTAIKVITGIYHAEGGKVLLDDQVLRFRDYRDSLNHGISMVYQEIQVIPESSIAENIMLDKLVRFRTLKGINWKRVNTEAQQYMDMVGIELSPTTPIGDLSSAYKQMVQIAKALSWNSKVVILDEPTSSLTDHESENLFKILIELRNKGIAIIFVSHKLDEVYRLCDRATVLRDGKYQGTRVLKDLPKAELIKMMIGRAVKDEHLGKLTPQAGTPALRVEHLACKGKVTDATFSVQFGEVLGFYGLVGSGRTELARTIIGDFHKDTGEVYVRGNKAHITAVADSLKRYKIGYVTENRKDEGLLLEDSIQTNITLTIWESLRHRWTRFIPPRQERAAAEKTVRSVNVKCRGLEQLAGELSGGNQQKVSIAKWLAANCDILFIDEPTVGVDIRAKEYIQQLIFDLAKKQNKAIILISSDMPEVIKIASRLLIFRDQRIVGEITGVDNKEMTYDIVSAEIGKYLA